MMQDSHARAGNEFLFAKIKLVATLALHAELSMRRLPHRARAFPRQATRNLP